MTRKIRTSRERRKVRPTGYQGDTPTTGPGAACDHGVCKQVRAIATHIILRDGPELGFSKPIIHKMINGLPVLLCAPGPWPPRNLKDNSRALTMLFSAFVLACLQTEATNLRGQVLSPYLPTVEKIQKMEPQPVDENQLNEEE